MIEEPSQFALNISTLIVIAFSANLLILRSFKRQTYLPLAACLLSIGIVISQPTLAAFFPSTQTTVLIFSLPALLLIAPSFWCYVQGITYDKPWKIAYVARRHCVLPALGLIIAIIALLLPTEIRNALLIDGNEQILTQASALLRYSMYGVLITTFALVLGWVFQSAYYFYRIVRRLHVYRRHLKDLFASTESKEIRWLSWLLLAVGIVWLATAVTVITDNLFEPLQWYNLLPETTLFVMIWSIAIWGLRQKPGLEEFYSDVSDENKVNLANVDLQEKYQRSALSEQHASTIAGKIEQAMQEDKLYLDASLSLPKLAKHISTSPNYISQTLNEQLKLNFFDFVNQYRVAEAKRQLEQTKDNVLDIAMNVGFNAKSSFYTAFKKETQKTPSQYRKLHIAKKE